MNNALFQDLMQYHPVVQKITNLITLNHFWCETFEHEPVKTSEEAAKVRLGYSLKQGAKAMIVRVKEKESHKYFLMLVLPGDKKINFDKVKKELNAKDIRFANRQEIKEITHGVEIGGIPPLGNLFGLKVIADPLIFDNEKIIFNAGDRSFSVAMLSKDYRKLVNPQISGIIL